MGSCGNIWGCKTQTRPMFVGTQAARDVTLRGLRHEYFDAVLNIYAAAGGMCHLATLQIVGGMSREGGLSPNGRQSDGGGQVVELILAICDLLQCEGDEHHVEVRPRRGACHHVVFKEEPDASVYHLTHGAIG